MLLKLHLLLVLVGWSPSVLNVGVGILNTFQIMWQKKRTSVDSGVIPFATKKHLRWPQYLFCGSFKLSVKNSLTKGTLMEKLCYCASVMSCESLKQHWSVTHQEGKWQKGFSLQFPAPVTDTAEVRASFLW